MFTKLPYIFTTCEVNWNQFKTDKCFNRDYSATRGGGTYFYILKDLDYLKSLLIPNLFSIKPDFFAYCEFTGPGLVTPHIDRGDSVALNFYIETDNSITIFYKNINNAVNNVEKINSGLQISKSNADLQEIGRFTANKFDCYLMDVTKIHGIQKQSNKTRSLITARWKKASYDKILSSLNFN